MKLLFDQGTPAPLRRAFEGHIVETAFERGWGQLENGQLVQTAESMGFDLLLTTDKNLRYQQNLHGRAIAVMVLWTTSWPELRLYSDAIARAALALGSGDFLEFPRPA